MHRCYEIKIGWNGINTVHLKGFTWMVWDFMFLKNSLQLWLLPL
jgi:hypothetical protein